MGYTKDKASSILASDFNASTYIGLSTTTPTDTGGNFTEPSALTGYERKKLEEMDTSIKGQIANAVQLAFNESIGAGYGTITYFGAFKSATGGTPFFTGALTTPQTVGAGYIPIFRKHQFVVGLDKGALESYG